MEAKITFEAFVLAGGKSSRMGTDKGLMDFQEKKMIEHVLNALKISSRTSIITDNEAYKQFSYRVIPDMYKNCGPLGGIYSGLMNSNSDWCIAVSCDLPFVTSEFFEFLLKEIKETPTHAIVPVHDKNIEPLCALYHRSCLLEIERLLLKKELKMQEVLQKLNTKYIEVTEVFNADILFRNMNRKSDVVSANLRSL